VFFVRKELFNGSVHRLCPELISICLDTAYTFDIHGSVHRRLLSRNTNKMQLCNRIFYFKVY
jgi:hypothetical protein